MRIGLDIGSITIKCIVLNDDGAIVYKSYERHYSQIVNKITDILNKVNDNLNITSNVKIGISGSAGLAIAEKYGFDFVQEVYATKKSISTFNPDVSVAIELGGEDAKILFLSGIPEIRMNGSCAGGTGAFIDQMATLLSVPIKDMNELASEHEKTYTIASRCGVFAKSDIQSLLNQGARKSDIAASIFEAVVNQTISGLAQGREIKGNVVYLGGPLTFLPELRKGFDKSIKTDGCCPENSLYYVAIGAALCAQKDFNISESMHKIKTYNSKKEFSSNIPLFSNEKEYIEFKNRHNKAVVKTLDINLYNGPVCIGIDVGSTTVKAAIIGKNKELLYSIYFPNNGKPVEIIRKFLDEIYKKFEGISIESTAVTGHGEEIIKNAFSLDYGIVETVAHFLAAKHFVPNVEFVLDIGGQDIKCLKVCNGVIDNVFLNEACSSGCGSFLQTFAGSLGYSVDEFAKMGLFAKNPVNLGSICTVFMNSSVKQAQENGATIEDISAGLSLSVVKNALYKVIRASSPEQLGKYIVVQGGTFLNDAVLRAFEQEMNIEVIRPNISGLMGAYGAAIYAHKKSCGKSKIINKNELNDFTHNTKVDLCGLCNNNCRLTVNKFNKGKIYIGGNRCERPVTKKSNSSDLNMYEYKRELLSKYMEHKGEREIIGIPMVLNMYELLPFWNKFFKTLGFSVKVSSFSNKSTYILGQNTIPSDTVCFPAKLVHGHIETLINMGVDAIFYPCMSYNVDENLADNNYNCPLVAYYPKTIKANVKNIKKTIFICDYVGIHKRESLAVKLYEVLKAYFNDIRLIEVKKATELAYREYDNYLLKISKKGDEIINKAREENRDIIVLSGRPYHIDPEINHGIDKLICSYGLAIVTEDSISNKIEKFKTNALNQWTYHARLYATAKYILDKDDMNLVQLVSFGCGADAITADEVREILEKEGKIYTQMKIDEVTNLDSVEIRLRSLIASLEQKRDNHNIEVKL